MNRDPQPSFTYQFRIALRDVSPLIWRRLLVPSNIDLARLSRILQILFSWSGEHLHCFHIHGKDYGTAYVGAVSSGNDPPQVRLSDFHLHRRERFLYQYDFTAGWELEVRLENILPFDPAGSYPICIGGKRAGPPGHCLGAWAYLQRMENTLGEEQVSFIESCPRDRDSLPLPDGPLAVGIDGGFVRGRRKEGNFEVIVGKSILSFRRDQEEEQTGKCFAFVQTFDAKPKRRLFELLKSQGMQENQQIVFLSDGGEDVRNLQLYLSPEAEHILDWFHLSMRITVLKQTAKGLPIKVGEGDEERELREAALKLIESVKWYLWHGNIFQALEQLESLSMDLESADFESPSETTRKLLQAINEFHS
ncbi:MAG: hypothetical protein L0220_14450 [Acidobacteria bacterium]|nr:hypothetical protein [Acidobacteriota bacterium]